MIGVSNGLNVRDCDRDPSKYCSVTNGLQFRALDNVNDKWRVFDSKFFIAPDESGTQTGEESFGWAPSENHFLKGIGVAFGPDIKNLLAIFVDVTDGSQEDVVIKETNGNL